MPPLVPVFSMVTVASMSIPLIVALAITSPVPAVVEDVKLMKAQSVFSLIPTTGQTSNAVKAEALAISAKGPSSKFTVNSVSSPSSAPPSQSTTVASAVNSTLLSNCVTATPLMFLTTMEISGLSEDICTVRSSVISVPSLRVTVAVTVADVPLPSPIMTTVAIPSLVVALVLPSVPPVVEKLTTSSPVAPCSFAIACNVARSLPARISSPLASSKMIDNSILFSDGDICTIILSLTSVPSLSVTVAVTVAGVPLPSPIISTVAIPSLVDALVSSSVPPVLENRTTSSPVAPSSLAIACKVARSLPARILSPLALSKMTDSSILPVAGGVFPSPPSVSGSRMVPPPPPPPLQAVSTRVARQTRKVLERESTYIGAPSATRVTREIREFIVIKRNNFRR